MSESEKRELKLGDIDALYYYGDDLPYAERVASDIQPGAHILFRYKITRLLNTGSYGSVYEALDVKFNMLVAVKVASGPQHESLLLREFHLMSNIRADDHHPGHQYLVHAYDRIFSRFGVVIIYPLMGGDVFDLLLHGKMSWSLEELQEFTRSMVKGLQCMHDHDIMHCDIKMENMLWAYSQNDDASGAYACNLVFKLADFGLAVPRGEKVRHGTIGHFPPEIVTIDETGNWRCLPDDILPGRQPEADIYALGVTLMQILTRTQFNNDRGLFGYAIESRRDVERVVTDYLLGSFARFEYDSTSFGYLIDFITSCIDPVKEYRLTIEDALKHDFLQSPSTTHASHGILSHQNSIQPKNDEASPDGKKRWREFLISSFSDGESYDVTPAKRIK